MDPQTPHGMRVGLTEADIRAMGLLGWDVFVDCNSNGVSDLTDISNGFSTDCDGDSGSAPESVRGTAFFHGSTEQTSTYAT